MYFEHFDAPSHPCGEKPVPFYYDSFIFFGPARCFFVCFCCVWGCVRGGAIISSWYDRNPCSKKAITQESSKSVGHSPFHINECIHSIRIHRYMHFSSHQKLTCLCVGTSSQRMEDNNTCRRKAHANVSSRNLGCVCVQTMLPFEWSNFDVWSKRTEVQE